MISLNFVNLQILQTKCQNAKPKCMDWIQYVLYKYKVHDRYFDFRRHHHRTQSGDDTPTVESIGYDDRVNLSTSISPRHFQTLVPFLHHHSRAIDVLLRNADFSSTLGRSILNKHRRRPLILNYISKYKLLIIFYTIHKTLHQLKTFSPPYMYTKRALCAIN